MGATKNIFSLDFETSLKIDKGINKWWEPLNNINTLDKIMQQEENQQQKKGVLESQLENEIFEHVQISSQQKKKLEQLAIQNKFVTVTRKQIFMIIMSAEDVLDASQKLMKQKFNKKSGREVSIVITECCQNEKTYNPYYAQLAKQLINIDKHLKYGFQYSLWDRFKLIEDKSLRKIGNLAKFSAQLASQNAQNLSLLKFFNLESPSEKIVLFVNYFLKEFLIKSNAKVLNQQILNCKNNKDNHMFIDVFRDYLKQQFYSWVSSLEQEEVKNFRIVEKTNFLIKLLKIQDINQEIEDENMSDDN